MEQISLLEMLPPKEKQKLIPRLWECMSKCANVNCRYPDGSFDYFPSTKEKRCINCEIKSKLINNVWEAWCTNYKERG